MHQISFLEELGVACAAMSDKSDGDCGSIATGTAFVRRCTGSDTTPLYRMHQVHGTCVRVIDDGEISPAGVVSQVTDLPTGDGLVVGERGIAVGVAVADCVPVLVVDPVRSVGAVLHAGRAGTLQGIVKEGVKVLVDRFSVHPSALYAYIGPSAGVCCYEVSEALAVLWRRAGLPAQGRHLDLWEANRRQLLAAGLLGAQIRSSGACTICGGRYHSYRAGGKTARNLAILVL